MLSLALKPMLSQRFWMTQEELAFRSGIDLTDLTYIGGIECGKRNPSLLVMVRIAKAPSVDPIELMTH